MSEASECLFCRIVAGDIPADVVRTTPRSIAFRDIDPQAPTHVLVIPRTHHESIGALTAADPGLAADLLSEAAEVAAQEGLTDFRLVTNTGSTAGQSVFHVHWHVLGGRAMAWPPG
jgi:histidine triad (HIT) family protein